MLQNEDLPRRTFLRKALLLMTAVASGKFLAACRSNDNTTASSVTAASTPTPVPSSTPTPTPTPAPQPPAQSACVTNGTVTNVGGDPLHSFFVSSGDVQSGAPRDYHIQGRENHDHILTLTADDFQALKSGQSIAMESGVSIGPVIAHTHICTVACAR